MIQGFLIQSHPLTNLDMQKYYKNDLKFNGVYSRDNLPNKIKDEVNVINLDEYSDIVTHWITVYGLNKNVIYFHILGVEYILKEIKKLIERSIVVANIFRKPAYNSIISEYFCIRFIGFILKVTVFFGE